jgi:hypothetical protein
MQPSLELIKITEKLQANCGCFDCDDGATMQKYMESFLRVLARLFCWTDGECSTILRAKRQEIIPVKDFKICGCEAMVELKPYFYKGFDPTTLKVYMHKKKGLEREEYELGTEKWNWSFVDGTLLVNLTDELSPCCKCVDPCSCEAEYKIVLVYEAGYTSETLPDCVYEAMCHFLGIFIAYQNDCGTLDECANMDKLAVGAVLKQKSVDYIVREWTIDSGNIDRFYVKLINTWAIQALSSLSLCNRTFTDNLYLTIGRRKC